MDSPLSVTRKDALFLLILVSFFLLFWMLQAKRNILTPLSNQNRGSANFQKQQVSSPPVNSTQQKSTQISQQQVIDKLNLQNQLAAEKQNLEQLQINLNKLKAQQVQQQQQLTLSYPNRVEQNKSEIQQLTGQLQEHRLAEDDLHETTLDSLRNQSSEATYARDQIDFAIETAQDNLQQTLALINYWQSNLLLTPEQQSALADLQNQFINQRQQLDFLRRQRVNISAQVLNQTRTISEVARQTKDDLLANEAAIQDRIAFLQNELVQIQQAQTQIQTSNKSLDGQINEMQNAYNKQLERVQTIEATLKSL